jgi:hypothetical protein
MSTINANLACRALELAEGSGGLRRMAALCVAIAAATTGTVFGARKALEIILHPDLLGAAQSLLTELVAEPVAGESADAEASAAETTAVMLAIAAN